MLDGGGPVANREGDLEDRRADTLKQLLKSLLVVLDKRRAERVDRRDCVASVDRAIDMLFERIHKGQQVNRRLYQTRLAHHRGRDDRQRLGKGDGLLFARCLRSVQPVVDEGPRRLPPHVEPQLRRRR